MKLQSLRDKRGYIYNSIPRPVHHNTFPKEIPPMISQKVQLPSVSTLLYA
jgi:hypothetical protein